MSDPRNVAHGKKVKQEKAHQQHSSDVKAKKKSRNESAAAAPPAAPPVEQAPGDLEKSQGILSKLKEMEFHSRANIETLAQLTLTIEEELKQKEFSAALGEIYAAQDQFHSKIAELIQNYEKKVGSLQPSA